MVASKAMPDLEDPRANDPVFALHKRGKMEIASTVPLNGPDELSLAYTPGVATVCEAIAADAGPRGRLHLDAPTPSPW